MSCRIGVDGAKFARSSVVCAMIDSFEFKGCSGWCSKDSYMEYVVYR